MSAGAAPHAFVQAHAFVRELDGFSWGEYGVGRRDLKQMSPHMQLAVMAALLCRTRAGVNASAWETLPVFVACPTGAEVKDPFLDAIRSLPEADRTPLTPAIFARGGVNPLDCLRLSVGTTAGWVAKYAGARGENASNTGFAADFFALQRAITLLSHGEISSALVVGGESRTHDRGRRVENAGVAVLLTSRSSSGARLSVRQGNREAPAPGGAEPALEALGLLLDVATLLSQDNAGTASARDIYGRQFIGHVQPARDTHA